MLPLKAVIVPRLQMFGHSGHRLDSLMLRCEQSTFAHGLEHVRMLRFRKSAFSHLGLIRQSVQNEKCGDIGIAQLKKITHFILIPRV